MTYEILQLKLWSQNIWPFFYIVLFLYKCVGLCNIFKFQILLADCFSVSMFISLLIFFFIENKKKIKTTIKINIDIFFSVFFDSLFDRMCTQVLYMSTSLIHVQKPMTHSKPCSDMHFTIHWRHNRN